MIQTSQSCRSCVAMPLSWMRRAISAAIEMRALRALEAELGAMDDRLLKDIGLHRSEIGSAVRFGALSRRR